MVPPPVPVVPPVDEVHPLDDRTEVEHQGERRRIEHELPQRGQIGAEAQPGVDVHVWITCVLEKQVDEQADDQHGEEPPADHIGMVALVSTGRGREQVEAEHVGDGEGKAKNNGGRRRKVIERRDIVHGSRIAVITRH